MSEKAVRHIFVNLAVRDLERSKTFFTELGFELNLHFTDEKAACVVVNEFAAVMLLKEEFFRTFTKRTLCDTSRMTEGLFALSCQSRADVDAMVKKAIEAGGAPAMDPVDHGFMYASSFYDPDGHHWEVLWMDPAALPPN